MWIDRFNNGEYYDGVSFQKILTPCPVISYATIFVDLTLREGERAVPGLQSHTTSWYGRERGNSAGGRPCPPFRCYQSSLAIIQPYPMGNEEGMPWTNT